MSPLRLVTLSVGFLGLLLTFQPSAEAGPTDPLGGGNFPDRLDVIVPSGGDAESESPWSKILARATKPLEVKTCTFEEGKADLNVLRYMNILVVQKGKVFDDLVADYVLRDWENSLTPGRQDGRRSGRQDPGEAIRETRRLLAEGAREAVEARNLAGRAMGEFVTLQTRHIQKRAEFIKMYPCYLRGSSGPEAIELANLFEIYALEDLFHGSLPGGQGIDLLKDGVIQEYLKALLDPDPQKRSEGRAVYITLFIKWVQFASADRTYKFADQFLNIISRNEKSLGEAGQKWARRQYLRLHFEMQFNVFDAVKFVDQNHPLKGFFLKHQGLFLTKNSGGRQYNPLFLDNPFGPTLAGLPGIYLIYADYGAVGFDLLDSIGNENPLHTRPQDLFFALEGGYLGKGSCFFSRMSFDKETKVLFCRTGFCNQEAKADYVEHGILPEGYAPAIREYSPPLMQLTPGRLAGPQSNRATFHEVLCTKDLSSSQERPEWVRRLEERGILGAGSGGGGDGGSPSGGIGCLDMGLGAGGRAGQDNLISCVFAAQAAAARGGAMASAIETAFGPPCLIEEASASTEGAEETPEQPPEGEPPEEEEEDDWTTDELIENRDQLIREATERMQDKEFRIRTYEQVNQMRNDAGYDSLSWNDFNGALDRGISRTQDARFVASGGFGNTDMGATIMSVNTRYGDMSADTEIYIDNNIVGARRSGNSPQEEIITTLMHEALHFVFRPPPASSNVHTVREWDDEWGRREHADLTVPLDLGDMCPPDSPCSNNSCTASAAGMEAMAECLLQNDPRMQQLMAMAGQLSTYGRINPGVDGAPIRCNEGFTTFPGGLCDCGPGVAARSMAGGAGCGCGTGGGFGGPPIRPGDDGRRPPPDPESDCFISDCEGGPQETPTTTPLDSELDRTSGGIRGTLNRILELFR